jgi:hypothetical protein
MLLLAFGMHGSGAPGFQLAGSGAAAVMLCIYSLHLFAGGVLVDCWMSTLLPAAWEGVEAQLSPSAAHVGWCGLDRTLAQELAAHQRWAVEAGMGGTGGVALDIIGSTSQYAFRRQL